MLPRWRRGISTHANAVNAGPALTHRAVGSECNLVVLDASDVLHDAFAVRGPRYASGEGHIANLRPNRKS